MTLFAVYSLWRGSEAVIVEAMSEEDARDQAWQAVRGRAAQMGWPTRGKGYDSWCVEEITLPYITKLF